HALPPASGANVVPMAGDFTEPLTLPELDGVVMANSLHFVAGDEQARVLARIVGYLRPGGSFVIVEYDQRRGSRWVPYPVPWERFEALAGEVGLVSAREIGRRRSRFGPTEMYAAAAAKAG
ncbi:MAG: class I SAM-dependent methyltransferase, partial [Actinobacteria bacterium]|nr:class I SAM-dependent methyltransferase [Actinomycetota bacterium]